MTQPAPDAFDGAPSFIVPIRDPHTLRVVSVDGWAVGEPSGFFDFDAEVGRMHADSAIAFAKHKGEPAFLTFVFSALIHKAAIVGYGGVELGFCQRIASLAYTAAHH
jgi:hypothetical protein